MMREKPRSLITLVIKDTVVSFGLLNAFESFACDIKLWVITACKDLWCNAIGKSTASTSGSKSSVEKKDTLLRSRKSLKKKKSQRNKSKH